MDRGRPAPPVGGAGAAGKKQCNCKNSRCLKLYCECFASGRYCDSCNCSNCFNNRENEHTRQSAVEAILERNPNAFRPKIQAQDEVPVAPRHTMPPLDAVGKHSKGCNCKKSACLKKYCECFQAGVFCSDACKCIECKNYEGSEQRAQVIACLNMQPGGYMEASSPVSMSSPMKRARSLSGPGGIGLPQTFTNPSLAAAVAALGARGGLPGGLNPFGPPSSSSPQHAALLQSRPILHQTVGDMIKGNVIEQTCQLLLLVADEEAENPQVLAEEAEGGERALKRRRLLEAQERAVLQEFLTTFRRMVETAQKKAAGLVANALPGVFAGNSLSALLGHAAAAATPSGLPPGLAAAGAALGRLSATPGSAASRPPIAAGIPLAAAGYSVGRASIPSPSVLAVPPATTVPGLVSQPSGPAARSAGVGGGSSGHPMDQDVAPSCAGMGLGTDDGQGQGSRDYSGASLPPASGGPEEVALHRLARVVPSHANGDRQARGAVTGDAMHLDGGITHSCG